MALKFLFPKINCQYFTYICIFSKSLQSCPTLCDPIDCSPPGSPVREILQARTLEWVAISFSNAWKWKVKGKLLSHIWPSVTWWTAAYQAPPSMGFSRQEYWSGLPLPSPYVYFSVCLCIYIYIYIYFELHPSTFSIIFFSYSQLNISIKGAQGFFIFSWGNLFCFLVLCGVLQNKWCSLNCYLWSSEYIRAKEVKCISHQKALTSTHLQRKSQQSLFWWFLLVPCNKHWECYTQ